MKAGVLLLAATLPLGAHVMSMSTGDVTLRSNRIDYILRMPLYEIVHTAHPETALLDQIHFAGAHLMYQSCFQDAARESYVCAVEYELPHPVDRLEVTCTLYAATVPNHVHLLRAEHDGKHDQAIFDYTFTNATLRFRPPTGLEIFLSQASAGAVRALGGAIQILFLLSLVLAARNRRELLGVTAAFVAGQIAGALLNWHPAPRFVESAAALSIAYLAVEILFLPTAGMRWLIAGLLGVFQGLYLALFLADSGYRSGYVLTGAVAADVAAIAALGFVVLKFARPLPKLLERIPASALLATGLVWFFVRLRG